MSRAKQVREVFHELYQIIGEQFSTRELLECSASLVELFGDSEKRPGFELRTGGIPFEQWSLDVAMADGGWRVLNHEHRKEMAIKHEEMMELMIHNGMARLSTELWG